MSLMFDPILLDTIWMNTRDGFLYAYCEAKFEKGVLVYSNGRVYSRPTVDTPACNTYFRFRGKRVYAHEYEKRELIPVPDWFSKWIAKNDVWDIYQAAE